MSVEELDRIDFVVTDLTGQVVLVMLEVRDWSKTPEAIGQLDEKFAAYAQFVLACNLAQQYPDLGKRPVGIRLSHFCPLTDSCKAVLRNWAGKLSGVPIAVSSERMYWNRLVVWFRRFLKRSSQKDIISWAAEPGAVPLLTPDKFTKEFVSAFRERMPKVEVEVGGQLEMKLIRPDGKTQSGQLGNAYRFYLLTPEDKEVVFQKYLEGMADGVEANTELIDRNRVVPILKDQAWLEDGNRTLKAQGHEKGLACVYEPYNTELTILYAQDTPSTVQYLTPENFATLKMEMKELRPLACANLRRMLPDPDIQPQNGLYRIMANGDYDACLLLLDDFWNSAKIEIDGELIAAVPARDFLVVTGSRDPSALAQLKNVAETVAAKAPYRLTTKLFVRRQGQFVPYEA
jgi:uncharacterized protein YtpQ (UPF0354 family)